MYICTLLFLLEGKIREGKCSCHNFQWLPSTSENTRCTEGTQSTLSECLNKWGWNWPKYTLNCYQYYLLLQRLTFLFALPSQKFHVPVRRAHDFLVPFISILLNISLLIISFENKNGEIQVLGSVTEDQAKVCSKNHRLLKKTSVWRSNFAVYGCPWV